jgi:RNA polymerase sigma factor (sigma-70 family)
MDDTDWLAQRFEEHRTRLTAVAHRMLGSASEADDAVQEAWLRLSRSDADSIENLGSWLTTVLSRVCLNILQARRSRPEVPLSPDVPEPAAVHTEGSDPVHEALLAESIGLALLIVLDTLSPAERVAFVLHDMFGVPFDEIAPILGRNAPAARQLASRARRRVRREDASREANRLRHAKLVDAFLRRRPQGRVRPGSSPCSTPTSSSVRTRRRRGWAQRGRSTGQPRSPSSAGAHAEPRRRSSTERPQRYGCAAVGHASSTASRSAARGSPPST